MFYELAEKIIEIERSGRKVVKLNIGDTNLPAPEVAVEAARKALESPTGYGSSAGMRELRELAAGREGCAVENIVVGPGSKHLIYGLVSVLAKKGGKIAVPGPSWPMYHLACKSLGLEFESVKTEMGGNWQFEAMPKADIAVICNPNNPTSTIYGKAKVEEAIEDARRRKSYAILDEAYRDLAFDPVPKFDCIRVRSFSKEFSMENWRLGYAVVPKEVANKLVAYNQITATCVAPFVQAAGAACLENEKAILAENRRIWKARMDAAAPALRHAGFKFADPQSAMYIFATHDGISDAGKFAMKLLEAGVAVAPGADFGEKKFFRIACNQEPSVLKEAIGKMGEAAR